MKIMKMGLSAIERCDTLIEKYQIEKQNNCQLISFLQEHNHFFINQPNEPVDHQLNADVNKIILSYIDDDVEYYIKLFIQFFSIIYFKQYITIPEFKKELSENQVFCIFNINKLTIKFDDQKNVYYFEIMTRAHQSIDNFNKNYYQIDKNFKILKLVRKKLVENKEIDNIVTLIFNNIQRYRIQLGVYLN